MSNQTSNQMFTRDEWTMQGQLYLRPGQDVPFTSRWVRAEWADQEIDRLRAALERMLPAYKELYDFRFGKYDIESGIVEQAEAALGRATDETSRCSHDWGLSGAGVKTCRRCGAEQISVT